ncbi:MIP family Ig-specific serine endopeptidase [Mycoplasma wenyonii]|uniref:MIP family Ig-specific serine endopeptidase n=1 Tax=Mycoplasma wenyonii TaxID=65123 RepID=UPI0015EB9C84|nr:hypothetical protein [Mycoplasma wenyonii]
MQALKWGIVAISGLTGVLVGTQKLVNSNDFETKLVDSSQVSSPNNLEQPKPFNLFEQQGAETIAPPLSPEILINEENVQSNVESIDSKSEDSAITEEPEQIELSSPQSTSANLVTQETTRDTQEAHSTTSEQLQLSDDSVTTEVSEPLIETTPQEHEETSISQISNLQDEITLSPEVYTPKQLTNEEIKQQAELVFEKLDDYTFKLFSPCNSGTGWILDYQLPEKGKNYPTTWYIATNAHVINKWYFDFSNPYKQVLPETLSDYYKTWQNYYTSYSSQYYPLATADSCYYKEHYGAFDINLAKESSGENLRANWGLFYQGKIKRPRLFWAALNLFDEDESAGIQENNFKDFAVIEIEFTNEQIAKEITKGFAEKYTIGSNNSINIFGPSLDKERLDKSEENFYSLGYPKRVDNKFGSSRTWDESQLLGDRLADDRKRKNNKALGERVRGLASTQSFGSTSIEWNGKQYERMGHFYFLRGFSLGKGASGSMSIDGEGNLIGLKTKGETGDKSRFSLITPIRSDEIELNGNFKTRKYDLIVGAEGQRGSFREQIERFVISRGKETWLSKKGWTS